MLHAEPASDSARDRVPRGTTPTWEMELLLSGATVFGLLAVPGQADRLFFLLMNGAATELIAQLMLAEWLYAKFALYTLIATFVLHLALRAYWIALVGLDSVYPEGIRWERLRMGPLYRAAVESRASSMPMRIEAADNRATRVFGVGVGMAMAMVPPFLVATVALGASLALEAVGVSVRGEVLGALLAVFLGPLVVAVVLDRRLGARLAPSGLTARVLGGILRGYERLRFGRGTNAPIALFQTNEGLHRSTAVILATVLAATALLLGQVAVQAGWDPGSYPGLPDEEEGGGDAAPAAHYAATRGGEPSLGPRPFIADRVVKGPYVELFVPFRSRRHGPALRAACPDAVEVSERGGPSRAALDCLATVLDVRLDGEPQAVRLDATTDPGTGVRGVLAMIPAGDLAPGRHELTVRRIAKPGDGRVRPPYRIPFWR